MLELVADALQRPRFDAASSTRPARSPIQSIVAAKDSDPRALIDAYGDAWLFRGHPYGRPGRRQRVVARRASRSTTSSSYYARQVGGDRLVIVVVGDFDAADDARRLETRLRRLAQGRRAVPPRSPPATRLQGRRVLLVDKPGATQTYFWLGNVGASRTRSGAHGADRS